MPDLCRSRREFLKSDGSIMDDNSASDALSKIRGDSPASSDTGKKTKKPLLHHDDHEHTTPQTPRAAGRISRTLLNFWLDSLLGLMFVTLCIVAVVVQFVFPPGIAARDWSLWGMSYGQWCSLQFGMLAVLGLGVVLHVMLHWTWICSVYSKRVLGRSDIPDDGIRTVYGVGILIAFLVCGAIVVGAAQMTIVQPQ
ncbi:hypothetical protein Fuma_00248 [Fuerstiella marisgermanici]|uniref:DUF4405 domain-containing protein n=2 Tax=Fuerstiella marisgermanici TaxID=1891926 RepID=A0A1P8W9C7_9PLAN|nr:hypothetical protein Fuma_00248 [Fuerstiella marisgermanici]